MGQKAEYKSAIRSKRMIRDAFLQLLKQKKLSKITVTDIVKLADINRATFYAHYPDVLGLVEEIENELIANISEVLNEFKFKSFFHNPTPFLLKINRYIEADMDFYRTLVLANGSEQFLEKLKELLSTQMRNDTDIPDEIRYSKTFPLCICYFAGGIINIYKQWFMGNLNCSMNDIPIEVGRIIAASSSNLVGIDK